MNAEPVSATWLPPPASRTDRFTACCSSRVPPCAAAAAPTTLLVPGKPCELGAPPACGRNVTARFGPLTRSAVTLASGWCLSSRPKSTAAHRVLHQVEDGG